MILLPVVYSDLHTNPLFEINLSLQVHSFHKKLEIFQYSPSIISINHNSSNPNGISY